MKKIYIYMLLLFYATAFTLAHAEDNKDKDAKDDFAVEVAEDSGDSSGYKEGDARIVVTGTRTKKMYRTSPVKTDVVGRDKMEAKSANTVFDALNAESGVISNNGCQNCGASSVDINGLGGNYTQILINGYPTVSSLAGVYFLQQFPTELIDRIEIVKGGGSALYGSGAIGGVVNIITRKPKANEAKVTYKHEFLEDEDSMGYTVSGFGSLVAKNGRAGIAIYGSKQDRDEWDANGDNYYDLGRLKNGSFGLNGFFNIYKGIDLDYNFYYGHENRRGGNKLDSEPFDTDICEMAESDRVGADFKFTHEIFKGLDYSVYYAFSMTKRNTYYGPGGFDGDLSDWTAAAAADRELYGVTYPDTREGLDAYNRCLSLNLYGNSESWYHVAGLNTNWTFYEGTNHKHILSLGYEFTGDDLEDKNEGLDREIDEFYTNHGFFVQYNFDHKYIDIVGGLRVDKHSEMDNAIVSPRINAIGKFNENLRLRAGASWGFKAPQTFDEDFHIEISLADNSAKNQVILNADDIEEEKSMTINGDFSGDYKIGNFDIDFSVGGFYTEIRDMMMVSESPDPAQSTSSKNVYIRDNVNGKSQVAGANVEFGFSYGKMFSLTNGITWIMLSQLPRSEFYDNKKSREMLKVPEITGYTMLSFFYQNFLANINLQYLGKMFVAHETDTLDIVETDTFVVLNTKLQYRWDIDNKRYMEFFVGIDNITNAYQDDLDKGADRDAGYVYGPIKPRTYYLGASLGF